MYTDKDCRPLTHTHTHTHTHTLIPDDNTTWWSFCFQIPKNTEALALRYSLLWWEFFTRKKKKQKEKYIDKPQVPRRWGRCNPECSTTGRAAGQDRASWRRREPAPPSPDPACWRTQARAHLPAFPLLEAAPAPAGAKNMTMDPQPDCWIRLNVAVFAQPLQNIAVNGVTSIKMATLRCLLVWKNRCTCMTRVVPRKILPSSSCQHYPQHKSATIESIEWPKNNKTHQCSDILLKFPASAAVCLYHSPRHLCCRSNSSSKVVSFSALQCPTHWVWRGISSLVHFLCWSPETHKHVVTPLYAPESSVLELQLHEQTTPDLSRRYVCYVFWSNTLQNGSFSRIVKTKQ